MRRLSANLLAILILVAVPCALRAEAPAAPLADHVPADAIVYVGWQGAAALPPEYATSHLKGVLDALDASKQLSGMVDAALAKQPDAKKTDAGKTFVALVKNLIAHPAAIYFGGADFSTPDKPIPHIALISQADVDTAAMLDQANQWIATDKQQHPDSPLKAEAFAGKYLVITVGDAADVAALLSGHASHVVPDLASDKDFQSAVAQVQKDGVLAAYISAPKLVKFIDDAVAARPDPQALDRWSKAKAVLNIDGIQQIMYTGGFDKQDWASRIFIELQPDRTGVAALFDAPPMTDDSLKLVPQTAAWAGEVRFDITRLISEFRAAAGRFDDNGPQQFDKALHSATAFIGLDVEKDLAACVSDEWIYYGSPPTYNVVPNFTIVNHLKDPQKAEKTFSSLEDFINGRLGERGGEKAPQFSVTKVQDIDVHTLTIPNAAFAPSWAIANGNFCFSSTALGVAAAALRGPNDKSILDNEDFTALRERVAVKSPSGFMYSDLPKSAPGIYEDMKTQLAKALQNNPGGSQIILPPFENIAADFTPSLRMNYVDAAGWHSSGIEPFPGSNAFGGAQGLIRAIVQPALERAGGRAVAAADLAHLRQIAAMGNMYADEHDGTLPPDLGALLVGKYAANPQILVSAEVAKTIPADFGTLKPEEQAAWINKNTDYVYLLAGKKLADVPTPAVTIAVYQEIKAPRPGYNMLFADGHAQYMSRQAGGALIAKQSGLP